MRDARDMWPNGPKLTVFSEYNSKHLVWRSVGKKEGIIFSICTNAQGVFAIKSWQRTPSSSDYSMLTNASIWFREIRQYTCLLYLY